MSKKKLPRELDPERQKTTIWLDKDLWRDAKIAAIKQGIDLQDVLATALR